VWEIPGEGGGGGESLLGGGAAARGKLGEDGELLEKELTGSRLRKGKEEKKKLWNQQAKPEVGLSQSENHRSRVALLKLV